MIGELCPELDQDRLALDVRQLARQENVDYLFLVRREKSYLFPIYQVYQPESYAYLCWTAYTMTTSVPVYAFYLHITHNHMGPTGTVVLLDYTESAADVESAVKLPLRERAEHLYYRMQAWRERGQDSTLLDFIRAMKGGESTWTQAVKLPT